MSVRWCVVLLALALCPDAFAAATARINWDSCSGPLNKQVLNPAVYTVSVSVTGHAEIHKGHDLFVSIAGTPFPDAWRFDEGGCQLYAPFTCSWKPPIEEVTCYAFSGPMPILIPLARYNYDPLAGKATVVCAAVYAPATGTAFTRYLLGRLSFDHTQSSPDPTVETCGGIATPVCIALTKADWLNADGQEVPFDIEQGFVTANDATGGVCEAPTPARAATWGTIRGMYRR